MEQANLDVSVGAGDIIHITIGGNVDAGSMSRLTEFTQKIQDTVQDIFHKKNKRVLCLVDISALTSYHPDVLVTLAQMMKANEPFVLRTATFGGGQYMIMAEDIVIALSGRKNLRAFNTKQEAIVWLQNGDGEVEAD